MRMHFQHLVFFTKCATFTSLFYLTRNWIEDANIHGIRGQKEFADQIRNLEKKKIGDSKDGRDV